MGHRVRSSAESLIEGGVGGGQRILLYDGTLWNNGTIYTPPPTRAYKTGSTEVLASPETYQEQSYAPCQLVAQQAAPCTLPAGNSNAQISDDATMVASQSGVGSFSGWYENTTTAPADPRRPRRPTSRERARPRPGSFRATSMQGVPIVLRSQRTRSSSLVAVVLAAAALLALVACDPVAHPNAVVREASGSPVTFRLLSGNGRYVVVTATGPSTTVPAAGTWRVDRTTGATIALPGAGAPQRISSDGQRILLADESLWNNGTISTPLPVHAYSPDLTALAFMGFDGGLKSRVLPAGPISTVEAVSPRPAGYQVKPLSVSDDARTVGYSLRGPTNLVRFVDLDAATFVERSDASVESGSYPAPDSTYVHDWFALSADGTRFAQLHETGSITWAGNGSQVQASWIELVDAVTGASVTHWDNPSGTLTQTLTIGTEGNEAWAYGDKLLIAQSCQGPYGTPICTVSSTAVAVEASGAHVFPLADGSQSVVNMSRNGRFLLVTNNVTASPSNRRTTVLDWKAGTTEVLASPETYQETSEPRCRAAQQPATPCTLSTGNSNAQMSDSGRVVAAQSGAGAFDGWYEYTTAAPPAAIGIA